MTTTASAIPVFTLRPATAADEPFLERLFTETLAGLEGLPPDLRRQLTQTQYRGRALNCAAQYPHAGNLILTLEDGTPAGRHLIERTSQGFHSIDLAVLPQYQRHGLATAALRHLQQQASVVTLHVLQGNPAEHLYRNLGFQVTHETELHRHMTWQAGAR
jgi:ribosomal protein S18 acetylase RimI-like enzyme